MHLSQEKDTKTCSVALTATPGSLETCHWMPRLTIASAIPHSDLGPDETKTHTSPPHAGPDSIHLLRKSRTTVVTLKVYCPSGHFGSGGMAQSMFGTVLTHSCLRFLSQSVDEMLAIPCIAPRFALARTTPPPALESLIAASLERPPVVDRESGVNTSAGMTNHTCCQCCRRGVGRKAGKD